MKAKIPAVDSITRQRCIREALVELASGMMVV